MSKADVIEIEGTVVEKTSECHVSGRTGKWTSGTCTYQRKPRMNFIKILPGDKVTLELSPCSSSKEELSGDK